MYDIAVLGAGVVGLSTAVCLQEALPDRHVTVVADRFTRDTTSDGAAGIVRPTMEKTPVKDVQQYWWVGIALETKHVHEYIDHCYMIKNRLTLLLNKHFKLALRFTFLNMF